MTVTVRPEERVFRCRTHGYETRAWRLTVCCSRGRIVGCEQCRAAFHRALDWIGLA